MRKAKWTITLTLALVFAMSAAVMAAPPVVPVQTPLSPLKIPQFAQPLDVLDLNGYTGLPVVGGTAIDLTICEFQTNILPPNTFGKGTPAPLTWVWGYNIGANAVDPTTGLCDLPAPTVQPVPPLPIRSYLGPIVIADRHAPTTMTFYNRLPNVGGGPNDSKLMSYITSTDQTLIWGDPLSLNSAYDPNATPPVLPMLFNDPAGAANPELNMCWQAAQAWTPQTLSLPAPCLNNYGFLDSWLVQNPPPPYPSPVGAPVPAAVHIHGGEVPPGLDGGPDSWWTPNGIKGHGFYSKAGNAPNSAIYVYPNGQEPAPVWFHDHMLGATRLNVYAGIAGGYVIKEPDVPVPGAPRVDLAPGLHPLGLSDTTWQGDPNARPLTEPTIPLIIQDRMFDTKGQLYFPNAGINLEHPYWVPEFVGDTIVVNGKAWPFLDVAPKRYKFLFLNGSNARAYELYLMSKTTGLKGPSMWVIGNDQGYLQKPQLIDPNVKPGKLAMMPGERYEVIIDFGAALPGEIFEMRNTARTPYVGGAPVNGQTTGKIIQFRVVKPLAAADNSFNPAPPAPGQPSPDIRLDSMVRLTDPATGTVAPGVTIHKTRRLTLNEVIGAGGPLEILVNNTLYDGSKDRAAFGFNDFTKITTMGYNNTWYSELPHEGETELWEIVNLTADAHPMHPHLVAFQVLNRQGLDVLGYTNAYNQAYGVTGMPIDGYGPPLDYNCGNGAPGRGVIPAGNCVFGGNPNPANIFGWMNPPPAVPTTALIGLPVPPMPQEIGWKDTVQALPNMVTRILVRFAPADKPVCEGNPCLDNAELIGYPFDPNNGHGYVWHCHIVDHEDNEMMRPYTVNANPNILAREITQGTGPTQY